MTHGVSKWDVAKTYREFLEGETFKEIGTRAGVSPARAQQIIERGRTLERKAIGIESCASTPQAILVENAILEGREFSFYADEPGYFHLECKKSHVKHRRQCAK